MEARPLQNWPTRFDHHSCDPPVPSPVPQTQRQSASYGAAHYAGQTRARHRPRRAKRIGVVGVFSSAPLTG